MEHDEYVRMYRTETDHWWYRGTHDLILRLLRKIRSKPTLRLLDAGCGTGRLCQLLGEAGHVTGCDVAPQAVAATRQRGIHNVELCNLVAPTLTARDFDVITCIDVIYHQLIPDEVAVLRNLRHLLSPGGKLILHAPAFRTLKGSHDDTVHTRHRYRRREIEGMLQAAGLTPQYLSYRLPFLWLPLWLWRRGSRQNSMSSDLQVELPSWLHHFAFCLVHLENTILVHGGTIPFGTSIIAVACRPS